MGLLNKKHNKEDLKYERLNKVFGDDTFSYTDWVDSGRFINRDAFLKTHPDEVLNQDCTDVILYSGDAYIQLLKSGLYYVDAGTYGSKLKDIEILLWLQCKEFLLDKKINNNLNAS